MSAMQWPLTVLLTWGSQWLLARGLLGAGAQAGMAFTIAVSLGAAAALIAVGRGASRLRALLLASGFPASLLLFGAAASASWMWLVPLAVLLLIYPVHAWRDAPVYPTPAGALRGMAALAPLPAQSEVLDAGCGMGDGLKALHREYPEARLTGVEWSWPLRQLCAWRCRFARVQRGDIWRHDWSRYRMVYLFQRPESMPDAVAKAALELQPQAWLVSLAFEAKDLVPDAVLDAIEGRRVWLYQQPFKKVKTSTSTAH